MVRIGFLLNPIAGMGGAVGLKGTDGKADEARRRGAVPVTPRRAEAFFSALAAWHPEHITWLVCAGAMGEDVLDLTSLDTVTAYVPATQTSADDTAAAVRAFRGQDASLVVFCGGDGTARDVSLAAEGAIPILGIPGGVKMYSGVFAVSPEAAAELVALFSAGKTQEGDAEITDLDEEAYRNDTFSVRLHGIATTLREPALVQSAKEVVTGPGEDAAKDDIARTVIEDMAPGTLYLLGAGSTTARIAERLGFTPTLLGIDAVRDGTLVARDLDERGLLTLLASAARAVLVLSPLGAQGFVIGRGTGPLTPPALERIGVENIVVVATPGKLNHIAQLLVDTGKKELDVQLSQKRYLSVIIGYRLSTVKKIGMQNV